MLEARDGEKRVRADVSLKHNGIVYKCLDPECQHPEVILVAGARGLRIPHFRHKVKSVCSCGEGETEWHLEWKSHFARVEIDMGIDSVTGEHNRADAVTGENIAVEFQHSPIALEEQKNRERFYTSKGGLIWVVDASGKRACTRLRKAFKDGAFVECSYPAFSGSLFCNFPEEVFPTIWINRPVGVIFDYGAEDGLVYLMPGRCDNRAICKKFTKAECADKLLHSPEEFIKSVKQVGIEYLNAAPSNLTALDTYGRPYTVTKVREPNIYRDRQGHEYQYGLDGNLHRLQARVLNVPMPIRRKFRF